MSAQTAKIIDLETHRRARRQSLPAPMANYPTNMAVAPFVMTWVPVWFVPVPLPASHPAFG